MNPGGTGKIFFTDSAFTDEKIENSTNKRNAEDDDEPRQRDFPRAVAA